MRISDLNVETVAEYLRLSTGEYSSTEVETIMDAAKAFLSAHTGLPEQGIDCETLDDHADLTIAFLALCQDMYDNRTATPAAGASGVNATLDAILGLHARNLV